MSVTSDLQRAKTLANITNQKSCVTQNSDLVALNSDYFDNSARNTRSEA